MNEHALANAFDVSEFVLANGVRITILDDWPKTLEPPSAPVDSSSGTVAGNAASKPGQSDYDPAKGATTKTSAVTAANAEPPAPPTPPLAATEPEQDPKAQFVLYLHEDACRRFGTVLRPEANAAHQNHFHLDMKTRRKSVCE